MTEDHLPLVNRLIQIDKEAKESGTPIIISDKDLADILFCIGLLSGQLDFIKMKIAELNKYGERKESG